jgi:hypothetical protein
LTKIHPIFARSLAMRTSAWVANSTPMPTAAPSIAAMTGFGQRTIGHGRDVRSSSERAALPRSSSGVSSSSERSVPAQNAPPAPVMTTTRADPSSLARHTDSLNLRSSA